MKNIFIRGRNSFTLKTHYPEDNPKDSLDSIAEALKYLNVEELTYLSQKFKIQLVLERKPAPN